MQLLVWIGLGGAIGAIARFGVTLAANELFGPSLPWGTLLVNVFGSIALGLMLEGGDRIPALGPHARILLTTGLLGAFTTFSTFSVETLRLLQRGDAAWAAANVLGNVVLSLLGAALGIAVARWAFTAA